MTKLIDKKKGFRKDINGLRAIAVIAVLIFHFYPQQLTGGFAGVDVFFVISGFLMTGIIFKGLERDSFSIINFYIARANRLIPALAVFCTVMLVLGWFFLTPWDYKTVGRDVATTMLFVSNIIYSLTGDYFSSETNFLLHTWTLSVEWQFYIIYPIILILLKKIVSTETIKKIILGLCIIFFIFSIYATNIWPTQSYFLLPSRAWEMLIGGIAYLYPMKINDNKKYIGKSLEILGLALIITSYFLISASNAWPGYLAAIPVIGTWLVIQANIERSFITNNIIFQKLGDWSYSIYLWHWPIAVCFSYFTINENYKLVGILFSIVLGFLSFTLIERRKLVSKSIKKPIAIYSLIALSFAVGGSSLFKEQGMPIDKDLLSNSLIQGGIADDYRLHYGLSLLNTSEEYDYLLIGDSHSNHYTRGILKEGSRVKSSWLPKCISFPNSTTVEDGILPSGSDLSWKEGCAKNHLLGLDNNQNIIIAQLWRSEKESLECSNDNCYLTGDYYKDLQSQLQELIELYGKEKNVYIIGELPSPQNKKITKCLKTRKLLGLNIDCNSIDKYPEDVKQINNMLSKVSAKYMNVTFINPGDAICDNNTCKYGSGGNSIFLEDNHLSGYGSEVIWSYIIKNIQNK